ncbi:hypothetical protein [Nocardioides nanhaiensis]|uniref:DUF1906 domain-containing protein n=1 Tax=Nocardioides nanhaiensis TaxID=1476871 RepID=A0ABP8VSK2_9ACTN
MRGTAAAAVAICALLAACAGADPAESGTATEEGSAAASGSVSGSPSSRPTQVPSPIAPPAVDPELRDLAEQLAGETRVPPRSEPVLGGDVSWPQCPPGMGIPEKRSHGGPMPVDDAEYVVVGLTNGPGFTPNPCLAEQVAWVRERSLLISAYAVASWPGEEVVRELGDDGPFDGGTRLGALRNAGYQQALFNVENMRRADFPTPIVWIDVEPVPDFDWPADLTENAAVVEGVAQGYRDAGYAIGVYSTPFLWEEIVGGFELGVPEWRAAGQTSGEEALARCGDEWVIQGGEAVLGQWVEADRDMNWTCPGISADLGRWFAQT